MSFRNEARDRKDWYDSVLARLDDLERQRPCDCVCNCCDGTIWLSTTLREGDTTWTSLDGDTRTLDPIPAATNANGGIVWSSAGNDAFAPPLNIDRIDGNNFHILSGTGNYTADIEVTTWWDDPHGIESHSWFRFRDTNRGRLHYQPPVMTGPGSVLHRYALEGFNSTGDYFIEADPPAVGLTGWARGRIRAVIDLTAYEGELFLAQPGGPLVSQGTKVFPNPTSASTEIFDRFSLRNYNTENGAIYGTPNYATRCVLHSLQIEHDGTVLANLTETEIAAQRTTIGSTNQQTYQLNATRQLAGDFIFSPGGAPLMIRKHVSGAQDPTVTYTPAVFTDGAALTNPAICWAVATAPNSPTVTNADPLTWEPPQSAIVYGVADLVGFDVDPVTGWPVDYWPFGPIEG